MLSSASSEENVLQVWHADTAALLARGSDGLARALGLLQPAERTRYDRFRHDIDRHMFLTGRVMARTVVGRALDVAPDLWPWREGPHGRPDVDRVDCPVSFNLAHSGGMVVCGLSWTGAVGVDVEDRARASFDRALVARCCDDEEAADVDAHGEAWRDRFLQYWTLKESYLKAVGLGISVHLPDVRFRLDGRVHPAFQGSLAGADAGWAFEIAPLAPRHYVAVAAQSGSAPAPAIRHAPFPAAWWP